MGFDWYRDFARPALFRLDPERAHHLTLKMLAHLPGRAPPVVRPVTCAGLTFPNPIGLAAGFDKGGEAVAGAFRLGFGHVEVGTITPKPQPGNPRPRLYRLPGHDAVINRFGFNSEGHARVHARLSAAKRFSGGIVGINLGANKESPDPAADYVAGVHTFAGLADYLTVNISSPNTPGLRDLQGRDNLAALLDRVLAARDICAPQNGKVTPVFLKVAPDLTKADVDDIADVLSSRIIDALIVSNTTLDRRAISGDPLADEAGGLSGRPLLAPANAALAAFQEKLDGAVPLIGVGGISSPEDVKAKLDRGACLVQLYTGLLYQGPGLVRKLLKALVEEAA